MRQVYPSDITRKEFDEIRPELEGVKKKTRPRAYDLYDIFCAVLYLLKEGCTWRAIPHDFPKWQNVRYHYDSWAKAGDDGTSLLDGIMQRLVKKARSEVGRDEATTMLIVDSRSAQNSDTGGTKGYDAGKKKRDKASYCG